MPQQILENLRDFTEQHNEETADDLMLQEHRDNHLNNFVESMNLLLNNVQIILIKLGYD
jgi:hypothetical protein